jgi:hypothetical protein
MKSILTIAVVGLALMSSALYAGRATENTGVEINFDAGWAAGVMWPVRSSDNDVEYIGCSYKGVEQPFHSPNMPWNKPVTQYAWCHAMDASEEYVACFTKNQDLLDALKAISPFSYVRFEFVDLVEIPEGGWVGECTRFDFSIQSMHLPAFSTIE